MNVERLFAIATAIHEDFQSTNVVGLLAELSAALQQQVQEPQQPTHQERVSTLRVELSSALSQSAVVGFSPAWEQTVSELGVDHLLGDQLGATIDEVFARNQITPATAHEELTNISGRLSTLQAMIKSLVETLEWFEFDRDSLSPGEAEVGLLIPRAAIGDELPALANELKWLDGTLLPFAELATGARPVFHVRSVSSSDFGVFLESAAPIAACIAVGVERIVALYKNLLEIRILHSKMKDTGVPAENLSGVQDYANSFMEDGISEVVDDLIGEFGDHLDDGRRNELSTELGISLRAIASRIDKGYNIEVRARPPEGSDDDADSEPSLDDAFEAISSRQEAMRFMNLSGEQILSLPEANREDSQAT